MRNYSIKWGRFLFLRWLPISWALQAIHVLDKSERIFRVLLELFLVIIIVALSLIGLWPLWLSFVLVILLHTLFWLFDSTWLVGFREVYTGFKGKGILSVIEFVEYSLKELKECDNVCVIAIYGSICRHRYHDRSDFDFRILQSKQSPRLYFKAIKLRAIAIWKFKIPIDLKIVDSQEYLKHEMREDEHPILPLNKLGSFYDISGDSYESLKTNPMIYRKDYNK